MRHLQTNASRGVKIRMSFARRFLLSLFPTSSIPMKKEDLLVFVIGATGTGKSKLAIDIASKFNGEVINADALQLYEGLDIVTNKVTDAEQKLVRHHLLGFANPLTPLTVGDFQKLALPCINNLLSRGITPVIAGGTMYYMESLLWNVLVNDNRKSPEVIFVEDQRIKQQIPQKSPDEPLTLDNIFDLPILQSSFENIPSHELHKMVQQLDPAAGNILHPNDKRKIIRVLQVLQRHKSKYSDIIEQQKSQTGGSRFGGSLRFTNAVIFWTQCEESALNQRLDDRVEEMIRNNLLQELDSFFKEYDAKMVEHGLKPDYTQGIFQAIGFKEFHEYLRRDPQERTDKLFRKCVMEMKLRTRSYARKQIKWIRNRFIHASERPIPPIFAVDTTNVHEWDVVVKDRTFQILTHVQNQKSQLPVHLQPLPQIVLPDDLKNEKGLFFCEVCDRVITGTFQFNAHLKSKGHRAACSNKEGHEERDESMNKA